MTKKKKTKPRSQFRPRVRDDKPTRQTMWAKKNIEAGRCCVCGKLRNLYARHCDYHAKMHKNYMRKRTGSRAWQPGRLGRPPKTAKNKGKVKS